MKSRKRKGDSLEVRASDKDGVRDVAHADVLPGDVLGLEELNVNIG